LDFRVKIAGLIPIDINLTQMGLCGGMAFVTRDIFESRTPQLTNKASSRLPLPAVEYILFRLISSFSGVVGHWLKATSESDHETVFGGRGLFSQTVDEARKVMSVIDSGTLCPIGVVLTESLAPWAVFDNHVELVYGYELEGSTLTLHVYDCNCNALSQIDSRTITLDISSDGPPAKRISTNGTDNDDKPGTVRGFFILPYTHVDPSQVYVDDACATMTTPPPSTMNPGGHTQVVVTVQNTGTTHWSPKGEYCLGYRSPSNYHAVASAMQIDLAPEHQATLAFEFAAPTTAQRLDLQMQMSKAGEWFGDPTVALWVQVGSPPSPKLPRPTPCDILRDRYTQLIGQLAEARSRSSAPPREEMRDAGAVQRDRRVVALQHLIQAAEDERRIRACPPFPAGK
jgi:hypothetical protein